MVNIPALVLRTNDVLAQHHKVAFMAYPLQKQIKTSVVACIINAQQRILLTKRSIPPFFGQWVMPGGKIDHGEAIQQALCREVEEEVGLTISLDQLVDVYEHIGIGDSNDHYIILYYRATPLTFAITTNPAELSEAIWFSAEQLPELDIPPGSRHILSLLYPEQTWPHLEPPGDNVECEIPGVCSISENGA